MQVCLPKRLVCIFLLVQPCSHSARPAADRLPLPPLPCQDAKPPDVNEILLLDGQGGVLEGMSSNVFVVTDGRVVTPDKGILVGTVRNLVLEVGAVEHFCYEALLKGTVHYSRSL